MTETETPCKQAFVLFTISKPLVQFLEILRLFRLSLRSVLTVWKLDVLRQGWGQGQKRAGQFYLRRFFRDFDKFRHVHLSFPKSPTQS